MAIYCSKCDASRCNVLLAPLLEQFAGEPGCSLWMPGYSVKVVAHSAYPHCDSTAICVLAFHELSSLGACCFALPSGKPLSHSVKSGVDCYRWYLNGKSAGASREKLSNHPNVYISGCTCLKCLPMQMMIVLCVPSSGPDKSKILEENERSVC